MTSDGKQLRDLTPPGDPVAGDQAEWSPSDSATIVFEASGRVWRADAESGQLRELAEGESPAWSPDGRRLAVYQRGTGLVLFSQAGKRLQELELPYDPPPDYGPPAFAWSPKRSEFAVTVGVPAPEEELSRSRLYRVPLDGSDSRLLLEAADTFGPPSWLPGGDRIGLIRQDLEDERADLWTIGRNAEAPSMLARNVSHAAWSGDSLALALEENGVSSTLKIGEREVARGVHANDLVWSANGRTLAVTTNEGLLLFTSDGEPVATFEIRDAHSPSFAPDRNRIALLDGLNGGRLVVADVADDAVRELTTPRSDADPVYSPEGARIAFVRAEVERHAHVFVADADGGNEVDLGEGSDPTWTPNGEAVVAVRGRDTNDRVNPGPEEIWLLRADGSGGHRIARGLYPSVSNDGARVAFIRHTVWEEDDRNAYIDSSTIYVVPIEGGTPRPFAVSRGVEELHFDHGSVWLPGDKELAVYTQSIAESLLERVAAGGKRQVVAAIGEFDQFAYSPDGTRLALLSNDELVIKGPGTKTVRVKEPDINYAFYGPVTWSPEGRRLAFLGSRDEQPGEDASFVLVVDADGSDLKRIAESQLFAGGVVWRSPREGRQ